MVVATLAIDENARTNQKSHLFSNWRTQDKTVEKPKVLPQMKPQYQNKA